MMVAEKACVHCGFTKPASDFNKQKSSKDGLQSWCRDCMRARHLANREAACEQMRQYHAANRDVVCEHKRRRRAVGGRPADKPWRDGPIAYRSAHERVKVTYGAASNYPCSGGCGRQAQTWAYDHSDPNPLFHKGAGLWADKPPVPYSSDPSRYDPMCRSCHAKRDQRRAAA